MGYYVKLVAGLALFLAGFAAFEVGLVRLLELPVSSCASGNTPYAIATPCPKGTGTDIVLLVGGIFGGLIGAGIFAFRGDRPGGQLFEPPLGLGFGSVAWSLLFAGTGLVCLYLRFLSDSDLSAGAELATILLAAMFIPMGMGPIAFGIWSASDDRADARRKASNPDVAGATIGSAPSGDSLSKIERLDKLRRSGALSDAEFETEKAKILAEG